MAQPAQIFREQRWSRREATARRHLMPPTGSAGAARHRLDGGKIMSKPTSAPSGPSDDRLQYPVEVLNRAARVFGVGGYMLGEHLLLRLGLIVSLVDNDCQTFPRRRD